MILGLRLVSEQLHNFHLYVLLKQAAGCVFTVGFNSWVSESNMCLVRDRFDRDRLQGSL